MFPSQRSVVSCNERSTLNNLVEGEWETSNVWSIGQLHPTTKKMTFTLKMLNFNVHTAETIEIVTEDPNLNKSKSDYTFGSSKASLSGGAFTAGGFDLATFAAHKQIIMLRTEYTPWYRDTLMQKLLVQALYANGFSKRMQDQEAVLAGPDYAYMSDVEKQGHIVQLAMVAFFSGSFAKTVEGQEAAMEQGLLATLPPEKRQELLLNATIIDYYACSFAKTIEGQEAAMEHKGLLATLAPEKRQEFLLNATIIDYYARILAKTFETQEEALEKGILADQPEQKKQKMLVDAAKTANTTKHEMQSRMVLARSKTEIAIAANMSATGAKRYKKVHSSSSTAAEEALWAVLAIAPCLGITNLPKGGMTF